jgi:hypothetical protein
MSTKADGESERVAVGFAWDSAIPDERPIHENKSENKNERFIKPITSVV